MKKVQSDLDLGEEMKREDHECHQCEMKYSLEFMDPDGTQLPPEFCPFCGDYSTNLDVEELETESDEE